MNYILIFQFTIILAQENCEDIVCSNIFDRVCGMTTWTRDGTGIISKFQNICHMKKIQCRLQSVAVVWKLWNYIFDLNNVICQVELQGGLLIAVKVFDKTQSISEGVASVSGRRLTDFSVVGAHQACNHTCPTYCVDTYEPACAQIWRHGMKRFDYRPMVNHCHIDLFSCALGVNVTIQPLGKCYYNPSGLLFMTQVAAMKSLRLLDVDDTPVEVPVGPRNVSAIHRQNRRRTNDAVDMHIDYLIRRLLK